MEKVPQGEVGMLVGVVLGEQHPERREELG